LHHIASQAIYKDSFGLQMISLSGDSLSSMMELRNMRDLNSQINHHTYSFQNSREKPHTTAKNKDEPGQLKLGDVGNL
jgi:hypothetical protein